MTPLQMMEDRLAYIKKLPETRPGLYLHLGCGPQILPGFLNIDQYHEDPRVIPLDISKKLPFEAAQAVYSSHALEHLSIRPAKKALRQWVETLAPGGKLFLAVPDLEEICRVFLDPKVSMDQKFNWYIYTMFGYQTDTSISSSDTSLDLPDSLGQYHKTGFTVDWFNKYLPEIGLKIREIFKYDGYGTPSIFLEAEK